MIKLFHAAFLCLSFGFGAVEADDNGPIEKCLIKEKTKRKQSPNQKQSPPFRRTKEDLPTDFDGKIIGGENAPNGRYPYQAWITGRSGGFCAGFLISPTLILSSAHCRHLGGDIFVGAWDLYDLDAVETFYPCEYTMHIHPEYNAVTSDHENDQMIIELSRESSSNPIQISDVSHILQNGEPLQVIGWGDTGTGDTSAILQEVSVSYVP